MNSVQRLVTALVPTAGWSTATESWGARNHLSEALARLEDVENPPDWLVGWRDDWLVYSGEAYQPHSRQTRHRFAVGSLAN